MSKREFIELIPRTQVEGFATSSHSNHTKDTDGLVHGYDARHWYNAYMALYETYNKETANLQEDLAQALALIQSMNFTAVEMEAEIERLKKAKKKLSKKSAKREDAESDSEERPDESYFHHGMGFAIDVGKPPRLYDLSDPDGTTPKKKIDGVRLELQPGRGFAIRIKKADR